MVSGCIRRICRIGRTLKFAGTRRITGTVDLYNAFNGNAVLAQQSSYSLTNTSLWATPLSVQQGRLLKFYDGNEFLTSTATVVQARSPSATS